MAADQAIERIVQKELLSCPPTTTVLDAARRMAQARCSSIVIVDADGKAIGIWTERDALAVDFSDAASFDRPISAVMSTPVKTIPVNTTIGEAGLRFQMDGVRHFIAVDQAGHPVGIISQSDVILRHGVEHFLVLRNVGAAISRPMATIAAGAPIKEAVAQLRASRADAAVVVGGPDDEPGIITERDIVRMVALGHALPATVGEIASRPLISISDTDSLLAARNLLQDRHIRHVGITDSDGRLKGLLSFADILSTLQYEYVQRLDEALRERDEALLRSRKDLQLAHKVIESSDRKSTRLNSSHRT